MHTKQRFCGYVGKQWTVDNGEWKVKNRDDAQLSAVNFQLKNGYKQTEVGVIPEDWRVETLGSLVQITSGESPSLFRFETSGIPYFKVDQLNNDSKFLSSTPYFFRQGKTVPSGSVIFPKRGASILLNKVRILQSDSYMDTNLMTLTPAVSLDSEYLYYSLIHIGLWKFADTTSIPQINNKHVLPLTISFPDFSEQRAIATALSDVDALLAAQDKLIAKKRDLKQATMQQLLTGKQRLRKTGENGEWIVDSAGNPVFFSGEWEVKTLGDLFTFSGGYSASRDQLSVEGHCYLHYGDIHGSSKTSIDTEADYQDIPKLDIPLKQVSTKSLLKDGDVVFVDASEDDEGTSKHVVVVNRNNLPFISGLHTIVAKSKTDELTHEYRHYCFQTAAIRQQFLFYAVGTKVSGISKTNIPKLTLPVPSIPEQTAIATVLSDMDNELAALEQQRDKTRALKKGMMQELLTGRIRLVKTP
ncbi:MAG: restriction endonuclease subunit S [Gallionella sp.]|nr:restriction endonuclease subunit S [Gallionella sp.]